MYGVCVCVFIGRVHGMCVYLCICCVCSCVCLCALQNPFISMAAPHLISGVELPSIVNSLTIQQYHLVISCIRLHTLRAYVMCEKNVGTRCFLLLLQVACLSVKGKSWGNYLTIDR